MEFQETLETLLVNQGYGTAEQSAALTEILTLMSKFPAFVFGENISLDFKTLFLQKYDIRELGSPTEELFMHYWREKTNEANCSTLQFGSPACHNSVLILASSNLFQHK